VQCHSGSFRLVAFIVVLGGQGLWLGLAVLLLYLEHLLLHLLLRLLGV